MKLNQPAAQRTRNSSVLAALALLGLAWSAQMAAKAQSPAHPGINRQDFVDRYCGDCHNDDEKRGGFSLDHFDLAHPERNTEVTEKMIRKLRAGMMPPPSAPRPAATQIDAFASSLERDVDRYAVLHPYAGSMAIHRLTRTEYANTVRALLDVEIDTNALLPPDDLSHGFNNISDAQTLSPALLEAYINAARKVSRLAVGDPTATPYTTTYRLPRVVSQTAHIDGTPFGTRGGIAFVHNFPADGEYVFKIAFYTHQQGYLFGQNQAKGQQLEISVDGARAAVVDVDPKWKQTDDLHTAPVKITAGPHTISAAFLDTFDGPIQDEVAPYDQSLIDVNVASLPGLTLLPHLHDLSIVGPFHVTGISETPSREKIFVCSAADAAQQAPCARRIVRRLVEEAYRKPAAPADVEEALRFYAQQRAAGAGFDEGICASLQAILSNPQFLFRFERIPAAAHAGATYRVSDLDLASRLSYFLWNAPPDAELLRVAAQGRLHERAVLEHETRRMLASRAAESLATNFASQWLSLQNLNEVLPDVYLFPNFDNNLAQSMRRETELFFDSIRTGDRSVLDLLDADYTFVDERLAKHYGIPNVLGSRFRRVEIADENRRGLLGQASILTLTSTANRTSPVARGKWVMQTLLGSPPPAPPPDVPALVEAADDTTARSVRQRLEQHRKNPVCAACHAKIDGIGFALESFDPTGAWRSKDNGAPIDTTGKLYDGTPLDGPTSLRNALLKHKEAFLRTYTENLMTYGLGRVLDNRDMPQVRSIVARAGNHGNRFSEYILGIVESPEFLERTVPAAPQSEKPDDTKRLHRLIAQASGGDGQNGSALDRKADSR